MSTLITLEDIKNSRYLWENGVMPGDKFEDGEITRVHSDKGDTRKTGKRITESDIASSPYLQQNNVKPNDIFTDDNEIIRTGSDSAAKQFMYGFDEAGNDVTNLAAWLDQYIPLGEFNFTDGYISAEERFGEEYMQSTPAQRRELQARQRERALLEEYGEYFMPDDSVSSGAGAVVKAITTPTTILPLGRTIKSAAGIGAGLGFGYSASEQLAKTGEVDVVEALPSTVVGAGAGAGVVALGRGLSKGLDKMARTGSEQVVKKVQATILQKQKDGASRKGAFDEALEEVGVTREEFAVAVRRSGTKTQVAKTPEAAELQLTEMIKTDGAVGRLIYPSLDKYLGALSTRIKNISEPVFGAVRKFEYKTHARTAESLGEVDNFNRALQGLTDSVKKPLSRALFNGNFKAARGIMKTQAPELLKEFDTTIGVIRGIGSELERVGYKNVDLGTDYFPRLVNDLKGLRNSFGQKTQGVIDKAIRDFAKIKFKDAKTINVSQMSNEEIYTKLGDDQVNRIIEKVLRNEPINLSNGKLLKPRKIETVTANQIMQYYAPPEEALQMYIRRSLHDIEKRSLFGRTNKENAVLDATGDLDVDQSIQKFIADEIRKGNINPDRQGELKDLLQARFVGGEMPLNKAASVIRDLGYSGTIANPLTALIQLGDLAQSATFNGLRNTLASLFGTKNMQILDIGIDQAQAAMLDPRKSSAILQKLFQYSGFRALDQLAKETTINASLRKFSKGLTSTNPKVVSKTETELVKKYKNVYGDDFDSLLDDLRTGAKSDNVKLLAFHELSDFQPISLSEMPQGYLENNGGRLLYMLKSFTLKQYDIVRRNIYQEWQKGNKATAARNMTMLAGYLTVANTGVQVTRDMIYGRDINVDALPDKAMWSLLSVFGLNQYLTERYFQNGQVKEGLVNLLIPATPLIDDALRLGSDSFKEDTDIEPFEYTRSIPIVGPLLYAWFGGGTERYNERLD